jgi:hypothetical protein
MIERLVEMEKRDLVNEVVFGRTWWINDNNFSKCKRVGDKGENEEGGVFNIE